MSKNVILSAGGTGGHMFPAQALAHEMMERGWSVHLATDARGKRYSDRFPGSAVHVVDSATLASKNPLAIAKTLVSLFRGYRQSKALLKELEPAAVVGFGGYPTLPPVLAAQFGGVPTVLHEQNAVLGRANKLLQKRAKAIAAGFEGDGLPRSTIITGNPLRPEILKIARRLYDAPTVYTASQGDDPFNLLVIGGSQGAQFFGETVPAALSELPANKSARIRLTLQAREEQVAEARSVLDGANIHADVAPFFDGMGPRLEAAHLMICRAGASTISEIAAVGRPSILVPYPFALDHDQAANAQELVTRGGAIVAPQNDLDSKALANLISQAMDNPDKLAAQARAASMTGKLDATKQLADLVEETAKER